MKVVGEQKSLVRVERSQPQQSLGIRILGGYLTRDDSIYGAFVRDVEDGSAAAATGELQEGDLVVSINGEYTEDIRNESVVLSKMARLFEEKGCVEIVVARSDNLRCEFLNILALSVLERPDLMQAETQRLYATHTYRADMIPVSEAMEVRGVPTLSRATLDARSRVRVEKLEVSLSYLGISMTPSQQERLHQQLKVDGDGTVLFSDFVHAVNRILREEGRSSVDRLSPDLKHEKTRGDVDRLKKEVSALQELVKEKEIACAEMEDEVLRLRKEMANIVSESRLLKKKAQQAEVAQQQAVCMEKDYQQVITLLETELTEMKKQQENDQESPLVKQRLAVLGCQIRKAEASRKTFRTSTDRLLAFTRSVYASLSPDSQDFTTKRLTPHQLGEEAGVVLEDVRKLLKLDEDELPFAWEESFTDEGEKYYVNHISKKSTWKRPHGRPARPPSPLDGR